MTTRATREQRRKTPWSDQLARSHPIFWPVRAFAEPFVGEAEFPSVAKIDAWLAPYARMRFREQVNRPRRARHKTASQPYDESIVVAGEVPTREGSWHDFMNALVWAAFPTAKRALHARQHAFVKRERMGGEPGRRLPAHDALAVLDEGGVIVVSQRPLSDEGAIDAAIANSSARAVVFGHAIFEAIAIGGPWPLVRAVPLALPHDSNDSRLVQGADQALAVLLASERSPTRPQDLPRISLNRVLCTRVGIDLHSAEPRGRAS